jgi:hypothetical protein
MRVVCLTGVRMPEGGEAAGTAAECRAWANAVMAALFLRGGAGADAAAWRLVGHYSVDLPPHHPRDDQGPKTMKGAGGSGGSGEAQCAATEEVRSAFGDGPGGNLRRLQKLQQQHDPHKLFSHSYYWLGSAWANDCTPARVSLTIN